MRKWARGRLSLVEIGVAEGASAVALREVMSPRGTLWLVDPFHMSRANWINAVKRAAHREVERRDNGNVVWIEEFSFNAVRDWDGKIDFLFIDGDHSEEATQRDWDDWSQFILPNGVVIFHDARLFPQGWTEPAWGPVRVVDRLFRSGALPGWKIVEEIHSLVVIQRS